jgi:hypothetical protein
LNFVKILWKTKPVLCKATRFPLTVTWTFFYLAFLFLTGVQAFSVLLGYLLILVVGIPLTVALSLEWSRYIPSRKTALLLLLISGPVWLVSAYLVRSGFEWRLWHPVNTILLLFFAFTAGNWIAGEVGKLGHLLPICILATVVDTWSVFFGPSKNVGELAVKHLDAVQKSLEAGLPAPIPPIFNLVILHWPHPGADIMLPLFGVGDLIFIAFFLAVCQRFALSLQKGALLVLAGLGISILVTIFVQRPIPALPFICGIFLAGNFSSIRKPLPGNRAR